VTDAAALAEKLGGSPGPALDEKFRRRVKVAFDGAEARPAIEYLAAPDTIRLTGRVPEGARQFTWSYGWTFTAYAMTVRSPASVSPATEWLEGGLSSAPFDLASLDPPASRPAILWRYLALGFTHILPHGLDHMLFVLGIYLLSGRARSVLWQVSAFTAAHSITLGLSMYGIVSAPPKIVEPLIALSIAYVAIENLFLSELKSWRVALVFGFVFSTAWASRERSAIWGCRARNSLPRSSRSTSGSRRGSWR
jgi:hypothetical protein